MVQGVEFCIVTTWESLEAIGGFAGERLDRLSCRKKSRR